MEKVTNQGDFFNIKAFIKTANELKNIYIPLYKFHSLLIRQAFTSREEEVET
jgi:hypothetical protein